ncbi:TonB-dependent receptor domain-containing protein [Alteromonas macleodii]|uniref:TonB-dependent receptor n=1 Tax=Alteromonas macleodii (strain English Channel 673) TaxID=1004788 RepID=A0AB32ZV20_ALTME|nr:TonB-dependent receptor [Alteromonas macleodii]AFS36168.1 TonB-dependent receptor [Alteromonas macleodii ATCC 27126]AFT73352.1 TonB-dependent receptor [Alteromonas macleodii str. 'English Channel 673']MBL3809148.1 TonB-dependent receptor plug domain-containing protein [Alteromonas macleodii]MBL3882685.1 TonB-dependent receptor plug domain-containing protein [Alteromonas macleodii]
MKNNQTSAFKVGGLSLAIASILGASALPLSAVAQQSEDELIEEVVATGTRLKGTATAVLQERQNQAFVADILGAEQISRTGDGDAAAALRRVTGLTLVDGKFIYVRGLGERYSSTQLNGMTVPSPDPTRSVVPLDLFPSSIIESLNVQKSYSPNMPGHFGGGNVNIRTKSIPSEFVFNVSAGGGWNTQNSDTGVFYSGGGDDWTGRDDGTRALPDIISSGLAANGSAGFEGDRTRTLAETQDILSSFNWDIGPDEKSVDPNFSLGTTIGNNYVFDNDSVLGFLATVSYSNEWTVAEEMLGNDIGGGQENPRFTKYRDMVSTEQNVRWSGMFNVGYEYNSNHKVELVNMILHDMRDRVRDGYYFDESESNPGVEEFRRMDIIFEEREMVSSQLKGTHNFLNLLDGVFFDWYVGTSRASREAPDIMEVTFQQFYDESGALELERLDDTPGTNLNRQYQVLYDESDTYGFNVSTAFFGDGYDVELKAGMDYYDKTRDGNNIDLAVRHFGISSDFKEGSRLNEIFSQENIYNDDFYTSSTGRSVFQDNTGAGDKYSAATKLTAGYFMVDAFFNQKFRVSGGARYEDFQQVSIPFIEHSDKFADDTDAIIDSIYNESDVLPSLAFTYIPSEEMQYRFNISQTLIRPDLRDISSTFFIDPLTEFLVRGSPSLVETELTNIDFRWEWYMSQGNNLSVALFYKDMENPIEMVQFDGGEGVPQLLTANGQEGELYGIEFEFLHDLGFISDNFSNFFVSGNMTLSDSEVTIGSGDQESLFSQQAREAYGGTITATITNDKRRLVGHSEWVANLQLGWDSDNGEHSASLVYNSFGERIIAPGVRGFEDGIEKPFHSLDAVYTYYPDFNTTIKLRVQNIFNDEKEIEQEGLTLRKLSVGTGINASITYNF